MIFLHVFNLKGIKWSFYVFFICFSLSVNDLEHFPHVFVVIIFDIVSFFLLGSLFLFINCYELVTE